MANIRLQALPQNHEDDSDCSSSEDELDLEQGRQHRVISEVGRYERKRKQRIYFTQLLISMMVLLFSMGMLAADFNCDTETAFIPLITFTIGFWLPQPKP
jgi:hypothetical protein